MIIASSTQAPFRSWVKRLVCIASPGKTWTSQSQMETMMKLSQVFLASAAALGLTASAHAANLVTNGGFETGDSTGWTPIGNNATPYNYVYSGSPHTGVFSYRDGNILSQGVAGLSQQLSTVAGAGYDISLWWLSIGNNDSANQFYQVLWDGAVVGQVHTDTSNTYTNLVYHVLGTGNDTVAFQGLETQGYNYTDDVSVVANGLTTAVPEPTTWAMVLIGFGAMGASLRGGKRTTRVRFT